MIDSEFTSKDTQEFIKILRSEIKKEIEKQNIPKLWVGIVTAYNGTTKYATIYIPPDDNTVIDDYPNLTNQTLAANDIVILQSINSNLQNAFVAFKTLNQQV